MKRMLWMLAALLLAGCEQSPFEEQPAIAEEEFYATFENDSDSRTFLDEQLRLRWTADDRITIFKKSAYNREFAFTGVTGSNAGGFRQVSVDDEFWYGATLSYNYAAYPHSNTTTFHEDGYFTLTMPAEQSYAENSVGLGANTMVAMSESGQLVFKNVGSFLRVQLYGADQSVKKITLSSNAGEALAGTAKVYPSLTDDPTCTMVGTTSSIVLNCEEAVSINATEDAPVAFWIVVPPCTLSEGYKVTVENANGETQEFSVNKEKTFTRNVYSTLKRELTIGVVPSNQVWYTATEQVTPRDTDAFGATYLANQSTYDSETQKGVLKFDGEVTKVGDNAFLNESALVSISLPNGVKTIRRKSFHCCSNLTSITIPNGVEIIDVNVFYGCVSLTSITIPNSVTDIGMNTFNNCSSLANFYGKFASSDNRCIIKDNILLAYAEASGNTYVISNGVTKIEVGAFRNCDNLTSVTLPSSLQTIAAESFCGCAALTSVTIPNSVTAIGGSAFEDCSSLTSVTIPDSVTTIGYSAFADCTNLTTIYCMPTTPPESGYRIFSGNASLRLYVPVGSTRAYENAEYWSNYTYHMVPYDFEKGEHTAPTNNEIWYTADEKITPNKSNAFSANFDANIISNKWDANTGKGIITFDNDVTDLGHSVFYSLGLQSITLPKSIGSIGSYAFMNCTKLTNVTIPERVTMIGIGAFSECSSLTSIYCKRNNPPMGKDNMFERNALGRKIYVPASDDDSVITAYQNAWSDYADAIEEYDFSAEQ